MQTVANYSKSEKTDVRLAFSRYQEETGENLSSCRSVWPVVSDMWWELLLRASQLYVFFYFYWNIIDIQHCSSLRCTAQWFDLTYTWNGHHNNKVNIHHLNRQQHSINRKMFRWKFLRFTVLTTFIYNIQLCWLSCCASFIMLYITFWVLIYNWKLAPFDLLHPIPLLPLSLPAYGNHVFDLFLWVCLFLKY